jgi:hypothetical protein
MQTKPSRLKQKSDTLVQPYQNQILKDAREAVADAVLLYPEMPVSELVELMSTETVTTNDRMLLSAVLLRRFYASAIRAERRKKAAASRAQLLLPGFEHLPINIPTRQGPRLALLDANYRRVRDYYWSLKRRHSERERNDPRIKEAKMLMDLMQKRAGNDERITVREVILLDR